MAIKCTLCGTILKDEARFCNICGTLVPSHPFSPKSRVSSPSIAEQPEADILPKQLTFNPPSGSQPTLVNDAEEKTQIVYPPRTPKSKARQDHVDQLDTVPMATPKGLMPGTVSKPVAEPIQPQRQTDGFKAGMPAPQILSISQPPYQSGIYANRTTGSSTQGQPSSFPVAPIPSTPAPGPRKMAPPSAQPVSAMPLPKQRKSRRPLAIILGILLLLLVGGGFGAWIVLSQPFAQPAVVQPHQTFANSLLGVSLSYPNGWIVQVNAQKMTALLADSSQTAQFKIISAPTNGGATTQFLQQEATQQGMTALKPITTQSFAGTSWQQLQGNVLLKGASYTEILFAAVHGQKMYTIMQLAPQSTYSQEEHYAFSAMRSSFQFVS